MADANKACLKWSGGMLPLAGPCVIGRRSDNDLQINNVQASRRHALVMSFNDEWWLNDLGSRNGVMVNGLRLTSARRLRDGDEIRIANQTVHFHNSSQPLANRSTIAGKTTQIAPESLDDSAPPQVACDLIVASAEGDILEGEKAARWFFSKSLERSPGASCYSLPAAVREWLREVAAEKVSNPEPFELDYGIRRLVVSLARCKDGRFFLLVREGSMRVSIERLMRLGAGFTNREAEVMHWICEGKTNHEIAEALAIAPGTVNHHTGAIYKKLGVDNRQRAVRAVLERLII